MILVLKTVATIKMVWCSIGKDGVFAELEKYGYVIAVKSRQMS